MGAVLGVLQRTPDAHAGNTLTRVADAALDGARGNSGAILAQFLLGLGDKLGHLARLTPADLAAGAVGGAAYARESLTEPREGTILSVLTDFAPRRRMRRAEGATEFRPAARRARCRQRRPRSTRTTGAARGAAQGQRRRRRRAGLRRARERLCRLPREWQRRGRPMPAMLGVIDAQQRSRPRAAQMDLEYRWCTECIVTGRARRPPPAARGAVRSRRAAWSSPGSRTRRGCTSTPTSRPRCSGSPRGSANVSGEKADDMQRQQASAHREEPACRDRHRFRRRHARGRDGPARHPHGAGAGAFRRPRATSTRSASPRRSSSARSSAARITRRPRSRRPAISGGASSSSPRTTTRCCRSTSRAG